MEWEMASLAGVSICFQLILVLPLSFFFLPPVDAAIVTANQSEEVRLLFNFKGAINGQPDEGYWDNWKDTDATPCGWYGVTCTANSTIEELDFSGWGMIFTVVDYLSRFRDLRRLDLSYNDLSVVFGGFQNFSKLTNLYLSATQLVGDRPIISGCPNLRVLALDTNRIDTLPLGMSDMVNLQFVSLAKNSFTGPFPTEQLGNLRSLVSLDLSSNSFNGSIPSLSNLTDLLVLKLDNNSFTGFEQPSFIAPASLEQLSVSNNQLQGTIPSTLPNLVNLKFLNMSGNNLSGEIPPGFSRLLNNSINPALDLSQNELTGQFPTDLLMPVNPENLGAFLNLSRNLLSGNISGKYNLFQFLAFDVSYNHFSGPFPSNFFSNRDTSVVHLHLNDNRFSGDIVDVLRGPGLLATQEVRLQNNLFTGDLSRIANTSVEGSFLWQVDLTNNSLRWVTSEAIPDPITATLKFLTYQNTLAEFRVGGNNFSGTSLPTACFVNGTTNSTLNILDISNSQLKGEISGAAFNNTCLPSLLLLNLSNNHATGQLSESIIAHQQDAIVDVSNNDLSGPLPIITLSSSQYNPKYFTGNDGLCGDPLPPCSQKGTAVQLWQLLVIIGGSVTIALGSCLAATWRLSVYHRQHQQDADLIRTLLERDSATLMPLRELKKATSNFAESSQIGEGGFGTVYVGTLNDGTAVAIKKSKREGSEKDKQQFLNEVRILSQVNHRNLVKLLGCCMENKTAVLVFEFVSNGTLQEHLKGKIGTVRLTWKQRLNIAVQTADALNYLHSMASFPIYHRDVKSANILLDDKLNAKVADFGISKLAPLQVTHVSTVAVQGTIGYMDPEYFTSSQFTDKSDVFSFGVVLLELISGRPALDFARGGEETSLVYFASPYIEKGDLEGLIDPALRETYSAQVSNLESILTVGRLAMNCLDMRSKARPSMSEVFKELENLWVQLHSTKEHLEDFSNESSDEDVGCDERVLCTEYGWKCSSSLVMQSNESGIQMSQLTGSRSSMSRSRSMEY